MKSSHVLDENMLVERGVDVLIKKLGPVDARRFIAMTVNGRVESVKRHRNWQSNLDKAKFFNEMFANNRAV